MLPLAVVGASHTVVFPETPGPILANRIEMLAPFFLVPVFSKNQSHLLFCQHKGWLDAEFVLKNLVFVFIQ